MSRIRSSEAGFTLIELLVSITIFAVVSTGFYSVMFAGTRSAQTAQNVAGVSEEARLGLNRIIRDTREGQLFSNLEPDEFNVSIDFDGDGNTAGLTENPNDEGDYEHLVYRFQDGKITLNGETLIAGVSKVCDTCPVFRYTSNDLRYDYDGDGLTEQSDLDAFASVDSADPEAYSNVHVEFRASMGGRSTVFQGQAQLRNRRELISDE